MTKFSKVPRSLVVDPSVSDAAVRLYAALGEHEWRFRTYGTPIPSKAELADELGRSPDWVKRNMSELDEAGWLDREIGPNRVVWINLRTSPGRGAPRGRG